MTRTFPLPELAPRRHPVPEGYRHPGVEAALEDLRAGRKVLVTDKDRGDRALVMAAEKASGEAIDFAQTHARGALRVVLPPGRLEELGIPTGRDAGLPGVPAAGVPVGLRANRRSSDVLDGGPASLAATVRALGDPRTEEADLTRPGRVFPVRAENGGGVADAALALVDLAGLYPAALVCGASDGAVGVAAVAWRGTRSVEVEEVLGYRQERALRRDVDVLLPTRFGEFRARVYVDDVQGQTHLALIVGKPEVKEDVLVHVHSPCLVGDVLRSLRCDCGVLLEAAMLRVQTEREGVIVYVGAEPRRPTADGIGLCQARAEDGRSTDDYEVGARIFRDLGLTRVRLVAGSGW